MTPPTPFYLILGVVFCVGAIVLASLNMATDIRWVTSAVQFGQDAGGLLFLAIALIYFIREGVTMLAEQYKKERFEKGLAEGDAKGHARGLAEGRAETMAEAIEADRQRRPGETLEQAMERIKQRTARRRKRRGMRRSNGNGHQG